MCNEPDFNDKKLGRIYLTLGLNLGFEKYNLQYFKVLAKEINADLEKSVSSLEPNIAVLVESSTKISEYLHEIKILPGPPLTMDTPQDGHFKELMGWTEEAIKLINNLDASIVTILKEVAKAKIDLLKK